MSGYTINRYGFPVPNSKVKLCEEEYSKESLKERVAYSSSKLKDKLTSYYNNLKKFTSRTSMGCATN